MEYVLVSTIADEFGMDVSAARKYLIRHEFEFVRPVTPDSRGQQVLALLPHDAERARTLRASQMYLPRQVHKPPQIDTAQQASGSFYILVLTRAAPYKVRLGFSTEPGRQVDEHRAVWPDVRIMRLWPCRARWENAAFDALTQDAVPCGQDIFEVHDIDTVITRAERFFDLMGVL